MRHLATLLARVLALAAIWAPLGCGGHKPADLPFVVTLRDQSGFGGDFIIESYSPSRTTFWPVSLPPGGEVSTIIGETPRSLSISVNPATTHGWATGAWAPGPHGLVPVYVDSVSYVSWQFGPFAEWKALYPSGVAFGLFPR